MIGRVTSHLGEDTRTTKETDLISSAEILGCLSTMFWNVLILEEISTRSRLGFVACSTSLRCLPFNSEPGVVLK